MELIKMARELGAAIQRDERYIRFMEAHEKNESDSGLNELIGKIQLVHMSYQHEAAKDDADGEKLKAYDKEFNGLYNEVMCNANMREYENAKQEIDKLMKKITGILTLCVRGEDPATCDPDADQSCAGDCSACGGCEE
ncbi:MAG: YlbF family regulator [Clostridiales bacterium]|jgi:cell fate (sporulation/competence/biofilm development) regulator YlbF (YheA/YmcA/DUF963 family)|nr:YlbF family regulator [Clostridiales bacterium]